MQTSTGNSSIQLDWHDQDGMVTVTPQDQDRYVLKVRTIIDRANKGKHAETLMEQLNVLQKELANWLNGREDLSQAYLTMRDGGFFFLVIKNDAEYSESLEDDLSELDIKLASDELLASLSLDVLALPIASEDAIDTFIDPIFAVSFLGRQP